MTTRMTTNWPRPDFLSPRRRVPVLAWAWAATGALVLAVTVTEAVLMEQAVGRQNLQLAKATQRLAKAAPAPLIANHANIVPNGETDAIRAAQRVLAQLGHPWGQILAMMEAETPASLQWLLLDHASDSPDLRLEGQAPDVSTVLQVVDALSVRPGWSGVALTHLQAPDPRDAIATLSNWRFEITAVVDAQRVSVPPLGAGG